MLLRAIDVVVSLLNIVIVSFKINKWNLKLFNKFATCYYYVTFSKQSQSRATSAGIIETSFRRTIVHPSRVTFRARAQKRCFAKRMRNDFSTIYRTPKRAFPKMPLTIPAVFTKKKERKKKEKKEYAGLCYSRSHSLNDSTMLGHSSKRHNASSMTGNARFR